MVPSWLDGPITCFTILIGRVRSSKYVQSMCNISWLLCSSRTEDRSGRIGLLVQWKSSRCCRDLCQHTGSNLLWKGCRKTYTLIWQMSQSSKWLDQNVTLIVFGLLVIKPFCYFHLLLFYASYQVEKKIAFFYYVRKSNKHSRIPD